MKRILLSFLFFSSLALISKVNAQCGVGVPNVTNALPLSSTDDSCRVQFDLSFSMKNNNGNKTVGIDLWQAISYTPPTYSNVPNSTDLSGSLGSIVIENNVNSSSQVFLTYKTTYPYGSGVHLLKVGSVSRTYDAAVDSFYFNIKDIVIAVKKNNDGTCPVSLLSVKGNVWSTNSNSTSANTSVQCFSSIQFSLGDPIISNVFLNCLKPRTLNFTIETTSTTGITVEYKIFKDDNNFINGDRVFNSSSDIDVTLSGTQPITDLRSDNPYTANSVGVQSTTPSTSADAYWLVVYYTDITGETFSVSKISNECASEIILPVSFKAFTATKGNASTSLKWTTASESNSKGFYVQRFYNGQWTTLGFVATKAENGNSGSELNYTYTDVFNAKGVTQYRIMQIDIDGKAKYSEIRSISNGSQAGNVLVYPNPATVNRNLSIVLANAGSLYDIQIVDAAGRIVKEYNSVRSTQQVSGLSKGQYLARVIERESGQVSVEKFIMQ